jgi:hypothetical protein
MNQMEQKRPLLGAAFKFLPKLYGYLFFSLSFAPANRETQSKKARIKEEVMLIVRGRV